MKINELSIVFVGGIHGVGKSRFTSRAADIFQIPHLKASELITKQINEPAAINKRVKDVEKNQDALIFAIEAHPMARNQVMLDGHFCVFDMVDTICRVPVETFRALRPVAVVVLTDDICQIQERLERREMRVFSTDLLGKLQSVEVGHAKVVCNDLDIPLLVAPANEHSLALEFVGSHLKLGKNK